MSPKFETFVIFAEMRTGSNFLEANLNAFEGLDCYGEAFNPGFLGFPGTEDILGVSQADRDADPNMLLHALRNKEGSLAGFRYFHDHDPRVFEPVVADPKCAKVVLNRNPVESYVSWKIAQETGQWKLTDMKRRKEQRATFNSEEFAAHVTELQSFQVSLLGHLQRTGQTAFYLDYEDLQDIQVINGLASFLGVAGRLDKLDTSLKKQNPKPLSEKVANYGEMQDALARMDRFNLTRTPNFEPRRGPAAPSFIAGESLPLLYMPIKGGPVKDIEAWMASVEGDPSRLHRKLNQRELRQWKRARPGHRSFTIVRHPVSRAYDAFCRHILPTDGEAFPQLRRTLRRRYGFPIPEGTPGTDWSTADQRTAFVAFFEFLKGNLAGQTSIRVDASWCSQTNALQGFSEFCPPDLVLREHEASAALRALLGSFGHEAQPIVIAQNTYPIALSDIYDDEIERACRAAYQRDYTFLGFGAWSEAKPL